VQAKTQKHSEFSRSEEIELLRIIADSVGAQFFIPKTSENESKFVTEADFRAWQSGDRYPSGPGAEASCMIGEKQRFFHWFLEFPDVMKQGGFDCILGNPPYLGGQALRGTFGPAFCKYMQWQYSPAGLSELAVYFLRRAYDLICPHGFVSLITTNSIIDGNIRKDGLEYIVSNGGEINMADSNKQWSGAANLYVSLLAVHKGRWTGLKLLNGQPVQQINTFFEEAEHLSQPMKLVESSNWVYQGSIVLGDGFILTRQQARNIITSCPKNRKVIRKIINGKELTSDPFQKPKRRVIDFFNMTIQEAQQFVEPFEIVSELIRPERMQLKDTPSNKKSRSNWWQYAAFRKSLYSKIRNLPKCFVATATTKYLNFSAMPTDYVFTHAVFVFATDRWDLFSVVQSSLHEVWARKYSGSLETRLRYSPSYCFENFTFPDGLWETVNPALGEIGEQYHSHRKELMEFLELGLTKIYNLFHMKDLNWELVTQVTKNSTVATEGYEALMKLRELHVELDNAVRDAYGWHDLDLEHDLYEIETLPENDRVRYTISPAARSELLKRLFAENQARATAESQSTPPTARNSNSEQSLNLLDDDR